jgi:transcriptional regulator with XRE-family HTH domain
VYSRITPFVGHNLPWLKTGSAFFLWMVDTQHSKGRLFAVANRFLQLVQQAHFSSLSGLSRHCGVSLSTLRRLEHGQFANMRLSTFHKIAEALGMGVEALIGELQNSPIDPWKAEYERLLQQQTRQEARLREQWDREFFSALELLLVQLPTVRKAYTLNPDLSIEVLLNLLHPLDQFVEASGFTAIGTPGEEVTFNPQLHQGAGFVQSQQVKIKTIGYHYRGQLLLRARVVG